MNNIQETVKNAMRDNGMIPPDVIITDGQLHRFKDESGKLNNWYTAHIDGRAAGTVGNWKTGVSASLSNSNISYIKYQQKSIGYKYLKLYI